MEELFDKLENIAQQNDLLAEQNNSLREQNELLRQMTSAPKNDRQKVFVENIDSDEIRDGFLVPSHRKKLWNAQINLMQVFDRICKKHDLRWFAYGGTLLGAARHKGYIPWDDDIDGVMIRPDFEKFKTIAEAELKGQSRFKMWYWFNYRLESDTEEAKQVEPDLPLISREQARKYAGWSPMYSLLRLVDTDTTYILSDDRKDVCSSICFDIFCLDTCPPFSDNESIMNFQLARELSLAVSYPEHVKEALKRGVQFLIRREELLTFLTLPYKKRAQQYELFSLMNFTRTPYIAQMNEHLIGNNDPIYKTYKTEDFDDIVYLPFEKVEVPAPKNFDNVLTGFYGDWRTPVYTHTHAKLYSTDIPYNEYIKKTMLK